MEIRTFNDDAAGDASGYEVRTVAYVALSPAEARDLIAALEQLVDEEDATWHAHVEAADQTCELVVSRERS